MLRCELYVVFRNIPSPYQSCELIYLHIYIWLSEQHSEWVHFKDSEPYYIQRTLHVLGYWSKHLSSVTVFHSALHSENGSPYLTDLKMMKSWDLRVVECSGSDEGTRGTFPFPLSMIKRVKLHYRHFPPPAAAGSAAPLARGGREGRGKRHTTTTTTIDTSARPRF